MNRLRHVVPLWLCAAALLPMPGWAAVPLAEVLQRALLTDSSYRGEQLARDASQEKAVQGRAAWLPRISLSANELANASSVKNLPGSSDGAQRYRATGLALNLVQPLISRAATIEQQLGELQARQGELALRKAGNELLLRTAQAYVDLLGAQQTVQAVQDEQALLQAQQQALSAPALREQAQTDLRGLRQRLAQLVVQAQLEQHTLAVRRHALQQLAGPLDDDLAPLPEPACGGVGRLSERAAVADEAAAQALEPAQLALQAEAAELLVQQARAGHQPTVELVANLASNHGLPLYPMARTDGSAIGIQLSLPLFAGGATRSREREMRLLADKVAHDWEAARRAAAQAAVSAQYGLRSSLVQLAALAEQQHELDAELAAPADPADAGALGQRLVLRQQALTLGRERQRQTSELWLQSWRLLAALGPLTLQQAAQACP